jgi:surface antigen
MYKRRPAQWYLHVVFGSLIFASSAAFAQSNLGFLNNTPIAYMTQRDMKSATNAVISALNEKKDGESSHWTNANLGNGVLIEATITPQNTTTDGDQTCRNVNVQLDAKGQTMNVPLLACRTGSGPWKQKKR